MRLLSAASVFVAVMFTFLPAGVYAQLTNIPPEELCSREIKKEGEICELNEVKCEGVEINKPKEEDLISGTARLFAAVASLFAVSEGPVGYVTSVCKAKHCVATYGCDGKLLPGTPDLPATDPLTPQPTPTPATPSTPSPTQPLPTTPTPTPSPSVPGGTGGGTGGTVQNPVPETQLPPVSVVQQPTPRPDVTFPTGPSSSLQPRPSGSGSTFGTGSYPDGVFSGGNPFYTGSTFGGAANWGSDGSFIANALAGNLFSSLSNIVSSLFSGLSGGGNTLPSPTPQPQSQQPIAPPSVTVQPPQSPPQQVADAGTDPLQDLFESMKNNVQVKPYSSADYPLPRWNGFPDKTQLPEQSDDRTGLPQPGTGSQPITGPRPSIPADGIEVPKPDAPVPSPSANDLAGALPTRQVAEATFAEARNTFLNGRNLYDQLLDRLGVGSREGRAYQQALNDLRTISWRESLQNLAERVREIPVAVQVAEGGSVITDAEPISVDVVEQSLTPEQRALFETKWEAFLKKFDAAQTDAERTEIYNTTMSEIGAGDPDVAKLVEKLKADIRFDPPIVPPEPQPALSPSRMLEGLSKIGERVVEAAQRAAQSLARVLNLVSENPPQVTAPAVTGVAAVPGSATRPDTTVAEPLPEPAPAQPAPTPQPTPQTRGGFIQGSISLLNALLQGVIGLFSSQDNDPSRVAQPAQPSNPAPTASASITANPSAVDDGDTTTLAWSSVGAKSCTVVDALLNVLKEGTAGTSTSPALNESTRYGIICDIEDGKDKFVNEVLVRVRGDESDPAGIFSQSGRVSHAEGTNASAAGSVSAGGGVSGNPQPIDVRTCDPEQPMNAYILCLCTVEPNPNGCSLLPQ